MLRAVAPALLVVVLLLLVAASPTAKPRDPRVRPELFWHRNARPLVEHAALGSHKQLRLDRLLSDHNFTLPSDALKRALGYQGAAVRLRRLLHELAEQPTANVKVGVVGGSISFGHGARKGVNDWFTVFGHWMVSAG